MKINQQFDQVEQAESLLPQLVTTNFCTKAWTFRPKPLLGSDAVAARLSIVKRGSASQWEDAAFMLIGVCAIAAIVIAFSLAIL